MFKFVGAQQLFVWSMTQHCLWQNQLSCTWIVVIYLSFIALQCDCKKYSWNGQFLMKCSPRSGLHKYENKTKWFFTVFFFSITARIVRTCNLRLLLRLHFIPVNFIVSVIGKKLKQNFCFSHKYLIILPGFKSLVYFLWPVISTPSDSDNANQGRTCCYDKIWISDLKLLCFSLQEGGKHCLCFVCMSSF